MKKININILTYIIIPIIIIFAYKYVILQNSFLRTNKKIIQLEKELFELKTEPNSKFSEAQTLVKNQEYEKSIKVLKEYLFQYPCSEKAKDAEMLLETAEKNYEIYKKKDKEKKEQIKKGFLGQKTYNTIKTKNTTLKVLNVRKNKEFIFGRYYDGYNHRYYSSDADKDDIYITIDFSVTSTEKNPKLPGLYVGQLSEDMSIINIVPLVLKYYQWSGHRESLGLDYDKNNDFNKVNMVKFSGTNVVPNTNSIYVLFSDEQEVYEIPDEDKNVKTILFSTRHIPSLSIEDFVESYKLIKIVK